jgi:hypothetical protein
MGPGQRAAWAPTGNRWAVRVTLETTMPMRDASTPVWLSGSEPLPYRLPFAVTICQTCHLIVGAGRPNAGD